MISIQDLSNVLAQVVPLYVAMIVAYGSVKWWKIFSPDQCSGINRFVALFAVPLLSFHFISSNNPYAMNFRFIAADTLQKIIVLLVLLLWSKLSPRGSLEWSITLFSLSTLPNTLVMGIPLLKGMYGDSSATLMVQIVVLQCIVWYSLMLFLFEFRGARLMIAEKFPDNSALITSFKVDSDVISLDGREPLETEAKVGEDGKLHVKVRKSTSSRSEAYFKNSDLTRTPSNLTHAEIYSLQSSKRMSNFNEIDNFYSFVNGSRKSGSVRTSSVGFDEEKERGGVGVSRVPSFGSRRLSGVQGGGYPSPSMSEIFLSVDGATPVAAMMKQKGDSGEKGLHVFSCSADYEHDHGGNSNPKDYDKYGRDGRNLGNKPSKNGPEVEGLMLLKPGSLLTAKVQPKTIAQSEVKPTAMPPATVMTKLILIMVSRKLIRNPNTYSSLIGLVWSLISFRWQVEMPAIVANSIKILSNGALGMAMFSLGLFMALQPRIIAGGNAMAAYAGVVRFIVGPAIMAAASAAVGLRGALLKVAIVQASLPQGIVPFVFAKEYNVHPDILSTAVIFGMLIALPIALVYYILLGLIK